MSQKTQYNMWVPLKDGSVIIDEMRTCGHKKSEHDGYFVKGHGTCTKCNCAKFKWKDWITIPNPNIKHG